MRRLLSVAVRSTPYLLAAVAATVDPAWAGNIAPGIAQVTTPANQVQTTFQFLGIVIAIIGLIWGALHFVRHHDWIGAAEGVLGAFFAAAIIGAAPAIIQSFGANLP
jgi:hypothetical protein